MKLDFRKNKYGRELLIDINQISKSKKFVSNNHPFFIPFYEIFFITKGKGEFKLDEEIIPYQKGTIIFLPPNKWRHWYKTEKQFDGFFLIFEEEFLTKFFNDALFLFRLNFFHNLNHPSYINLNEQELTTTLQNLNEIQTEIKNLNPDSDHLLRSVLYYLLIKLNRKHIDQYNVDKNFYKETLILKFRKLLEEHYIEKQRVNDYAELLQISKSHLNKLLNHYFGKSCSTIIKERLIIEIKKQLLFSNKSIAEIGYQLNFPDPPNFNRFFHKHEKLTPNQYRIQNDNS